MRKDPSGKVQPFSIDDGADDPEETMDNIAFDEEEVGNTLPSLEEARETIPHRTTMAPAKRNRLFVYGCMALVIVALVVTTVVLAVDLNNVKNEAVVMTHKEELFQILVNKNVSTEDSLRAARSSQSQALNYLAEEESNSDMSWLYSDMVKNEQRMIERYILALVFFETNGDQDWTSDYNFLSAQDHCDWNAVFSEGREGVTSCNDEGHVTALELGKPTTLTECWKGRSVLYFVFAHSLFACIIEVENNLRSSEDFPYEIRHFTQLHTLALFNNELGGNFPSGIQELTNLNIIAISGNDMRGTLPTGLGDLTRLSMLLMSNNKFSGEVPSSLSHLSALTWLALDDNSFSGDLDQLLSNMVYLTRLDVEDNDFSGSLNWLDRLSVLGVMDVSNNKLGGAIPSSLVNHPTLQLADVHGNALSGNLPVVVGENTKLQLLIIHSNNIGGIVPEQIGLFREMKVLDISFNAFTGTLPSLDSLSQLEFLTTSGNNFTEQPMPFLQSLVKLIDVSMKGNNIQGAIPEWIGDLTALRWLDLDANLLTGAIPSEIGQLDGLETLLLNRNDLNGTIPAEMSGLLKLETVLIDGNSINGNATGLCNRNDPINLFISDCLDGVNGEPAQLDCPCCSKCCISGDAACSDFEWTVKLDLLGNGLTRSIFFDTTDASAVFSKINDENP